MPTLRKAVFYIFLLLYIGICPWLVLYSLGYVLKPGSARGFVQTGGIHLSTEPAGAAVYLDGRRYSERTPTSLVGLLPGQYSVRITARKHWPWVGRIPVEPEKVTVLEKIRLLPKPGKRGAVEP